MEHKPNLPERLQKEVELFFEQAPPARLSRNLRRLLLSHLSIEEGGYGMNVQDLFVDMMWLFELLDVAEDELKPAAQM